MIRDITITLQPKNENNKGLINSLLYKQLHEMNLQIDGRKINDSEVSFVFVKKSVDARHGNVKLHLKYKAYIGEKPENQQEKLPEWKKTDGKKSVLIIGCGPAGLFGALKLLESGIKPVIIERGTTTLQRKKDIAKISTQNLVDENSNYCFGEGGAGTFSDGKLYTRSNKRGDVSGILKIFNYFGADEKILTDAHPHIGTDRLPKVIDSMCEKIQELGGEIYFNHKAVDFIFDDENVENGGDESISGRGGKISETSTSVKGILAQNTQTGETKTFLADAVVLATGHSATDIYMLLAKKVPAALEAKTFAAGVRAEHPRYIIDGIQYHHKAGKTLGAAEYRVTTQVDERGVYSFCMCPGGFVVPSASGPHEIVINGMSAAARNSKWSNAAIVVEIRPEDIPEQFKKQAEELGCPACAGLLFRSDLEKLTKEHGNGQAAPAQRLVDFLDGKKSASLPESSYTPGLVSSNLNEWLPSHINERLKKGFRIINKDMKGFICDDALLIASETRTSTPVRIVRNKESFECSSVKGLYPAGEGSGYSGGIVSSAMDGENVCAAIAKKLLG